MQFKRVAIDTSKHVFTLHGIDDADQPRLRRDLRRSQVRDFFARLAPTEVALEACGASHHWGRLLISLGHQVRLIPPQYVKPFVKRSKNDQADAEAICEAAGRPAMRFVPVKPVEAQAAATVLSVRDLLVKQRTQLINAIRGHAAEFGVIGAKGDGLPGLLGKVAVDEAVPAAARQMISFLGERLAELEGQIGELDREIGRQHAASPLSQLLDDIPGIGPLSALTFALKVDPTQFTSGRHFAAWLGLVPRQNSSAGKTRLGRISREGNERLRQLLVVGATSVILAVRRGGRVGSQWLSKLLERRPRKVVAVALANKMARILWAMMASGEEYRRQPA